MSKQYDSYYKIFIFLLLSFFFLGCSSEKVVDDHNSGNANESSSIISNQYQEESSLNNIPPQSRTDSNTTVIDLLVLYDTNKYKNNPSLAEAKIIQSIVVANSIYTRSGLNIELNLVSMESYEIMQDLDSKSVLNLIRKDTKVKELRTLYHADEVVIFRDYANDGMCGIAYQNNHLSPSQAYAHVSLDCPSYTLAHELGHTMGLTHSEYDVHEGYSFYAKGYGMDSEFVTIMAYKSNYHTNRKVLRYSSPSSECFDQECGVENEADASRALKEVISTVSSFR